MTKPMKKLPQESWEKKFDNKFKGKFNFDNWLNVDGVSPGQIKHFIHQILTSDRQRVVEEIEDAVQWAIDNSKGDSYHEGLEEAKHILHLIKDKL